MILNLACTAVYQREYALGALAGSSLAVILYPGLRFHVSSEEI